MAAECDDKKKYTGGYRLDKPKIPWETTVAVAAPWDSPLWPKVIDDGTKAAVNTATETAATAAVAKPVERTRQQAKTEQVMCELMSTGGHYFGQPSLYELIVAKKVDPHHKCAALGSNTLLHWLCHPSPEGRVLSAKALLAIGADPKALNASNQTPLALAVASSQQPMIDLLFPIT